eukprot:162043_1
MWILLNILFLSSVSGSGYILVKDKQLTWGKADAYCKKEYKTRLATIRNDKDAKALLTKAQSNVSPHPFGELWIGLNDRMKEGHWIFSDNTGCPKVTDSCDKLKYWWPGQPNNAKPHPPGQDCGQIHTIDSPWIPNDIKKITINNMLNDWYCYKEFRFICDCPCRTAGFNLEIKHYCECRTSCGEDICNPIESLIEVFGGAPLPGDTLCMGDSQDQTCCCSCPNCPGYSDLGVV